MAGSKAEVGNTVLATTFVSAGQLTATIPASLLSDEGTVAISVMNPTPGGGTSSAVNLTVTDAAITATGAEVSQLPGVQGKGLVVATFTDAGGVDPANAYSAVITWGDGSTSSAGTIVAAKGGGFQVLGDHTYTLLGVFPTTVAILDKGGSAASATSRSVIGTLNQQYVSALFQSLYGRTVDSASLNTYTSQLDFGVLRTKVAEKLTHTPEYFATIIEPAYAEFFGRAADPDGLAFWTAQMQAGLTDEQLQAQFIGSPEYYAHAGGTDKAWVTAMYENLLNRPPDQAGIDFWTGRLAAGALRSDVALGFAISPEHEAILVQGYYSRYLGRAGAPADVAFWVNAFGKGTTNEDLVSSFVASDEYFGQHVTAP